MFYSEPDLFAVFQVFSHVFSHRDWSKKGGKRPCLSFLSSVQGQKDFLSSHYVCKNANFNGTQTHLKCVTLMVDNDHWYWWLSPPVGRSVDWSLTPSVLGKGTEARVAPDALYECVRLGEWGLRMCFQCWNEQKEATEVPAYLPFQRYNKHLQPHSMCAQ